MTSNVELATPKIAPIVDDPDIDVFTQRPRSFGANRHGPPPNQGARLPPDPSPFFSTGMTQVSDRRFTKERYVCKVPRTNLYGNSADYMYIGERRSRKPSREFSGSRVGAYYPWPPEKAGEKVAQHLHKESQSSLVGIDLVRRPPTNEIGSVRMAFGRAAPGYYSQRYPNKKTWFGSSVMEGRDPSTLYSLPERTLDEYDICQEHQFQYLASLPETTEYQDRYLAYIPTAKPSTIFRIRQAGFK